MSIRNKILWGLLIGFVVIGVVTTIATRYAVILSVKQGSPASRMIPAVITQTEGGIRVRARVLSERDTAYDVLLVTSFLIFEVEVENRGKDWIDLDHAQFFFQDGDRWIRPLSREEVSSAITGRFIGTSLSPSGTGRQMSLIQKADEGMLDTARIFPGFQRKGLVFFNLSATIEEPIILKLEEVRTPEKKIGPFVFRFSFRS